MPVTHGRNHAVLFEVCFHARKGKASRFYQIPSHSLQPFITQQEERQERSHGDSGLPWSLFTNSIISLL